MKKIFPIIFILFFIGCKGKVERKIDLKRKGAFSLILFKKDLKNPLVSKERAAKIYKDLIEKNITFEDAVRISDNNELFKAKEGFIGIQRLGLFSVPISEAEEEALLNLKGGEISSIIELPYDYAIFRKEEIREDLGLNHILISWKGAYGCPIGIQRSKEQAYKMAEEAIKELEEGKSWSFVAKKYSNGLEAKRGGYLGIFLPKALFPSHREVVLNLKEGEVSPILESILGFHIYQKTKPWPDVIGLKHIMIAYQGALMAPFTITRSKEEAKELAENLRKRIIEGEDFGKIARKYSDDKSTYKNNGDLGIICLDKFIPIELEEVAFNLEINKVSEVVESPGGYHILLRYE